MTRTDGSPRRPSRVAIEVDRAGDEQHADQHDFPLRERILDRENDRERAGRNTAPAVRENEVPRRERHERVNVHELEEREGVEHPQPRVHVTVVVGPGQQAAPRLRAQERAGGSANSCEEHHTRQPWRRARLVRVREAPPRQVAHRRFVADPHQQGTRVQQEQRHQNVSHREVRHQRSREDDIRGPEPRTE